ncbi:NAD(P)-dependent alcohol dehydrogenase, partial [Lutimonas sp.]|uniref:NAD(P)-dependent alcohol dehydrogenase n=1 Tax=Lutimonas sp. TaxID=1872403 RepID=UPI003D9BFD85
MLGLFKPKRSVIGSDFAGKIVAKGNLVKDFDLEDRVFGFVDQGVGSQAQFMSISRDHLFRIPKDVDYKTAAAGLEGAHYAYTFLHKVSIVDGQSILINGATGGIGSALLQFVNQYDVNITATANTRNVALIKSLGADRVIDYTKEDFTKISEKFDFVFDAVGKSTFGKCRPLLKEKGVYISSELGPYSQNLFFSLYSLFFGKQKVIFPYPYPQKKTIPYISQCLLNKTFNPVIDRVYSFENIAKAYEYVLKGEKTGNVVISVNDDQ